MADSDNSRTLPGVARGSFHSSPTGSFATAITHPSDVFRRTPAPPPFLGINSTPAASSACRIARKFAPVRDVTPSSTSARLTVATPIPAAFARSFALQRISARAARICAPVISLLSSDFELINAISCASSTFSGAAVHSRRVASRELRLYPVLTHRAQPDQNQADRSSDHG